MRDEHTVMIGKLFEKIVPVVATCGSRAPPSTVTVFCDGFFKDRAP
jgi:hypothetical protein